MSNQPFTIERTFNAPVAKVWKAITDKEQMKLWYFDLAEFKPEVGFEFTFEGGPDDGPKYLHLCKVTEVIEGKKLKHSWRYDGYEGNSFVTWELFDEGGRTRVKLTHEGLETFPVTNPDLARSNFEAGWTDIVGNMLREFVETDTLNKSIEINTPADRVWEVITDHSVNPKWAAAFHEGTTVSTSWQKGTDVVWKDGEGTPMVKGIVDVNEPARQLRLRYYDDVNSPPTEPIGEYAENFLLSESDGKTVLKIEAGPLAVKWTKMHEPMWDEALKRIKHLAEA